MAQKPFVIFLHGIFGSRLSASDGEEVWPPTASEYIRKAYRRTDKLLDPGLLVTDIIRRASCCDVYQPVIDDFEKIGYSENADGEVGTLILFNYDWRKDLRSTSDSLAETLDTLAPDAEIRLVAHSMGGLVCRDLLESGRYSVRSWFPKVRALITLGTPHMGAPLALLRAAGLDGAMGMSASDVKRLAGDSRYPSAYQLLPPPGTAYVRDVNEGEDKGFVVDTFNQGFITSHGLSAANMQANRDFHAGLDLVQRRPSHVDYYLFASSTEETLNRFQTASGQLLPLKDRRGGDETVPAASAASPFASTEFVAGAHGKIFRDVSLRNRLYRLLGAPIAIRPSSATDRPAEDALVANLVIPDEPVSRGAVISVNLVFREPVTEFKDTIVFEPLREIGPPAEVPVGDSSVMDVSYEGAPLEVLSLRVRAPAKAGFYAAKLAQNELGEPVQLVLTVSTDGVPNND
ncbi:MAG: hypothetical protein AAFU80_02180 [Pseudomonadota bacterium]